MFSIAYFIFLGIKKHIVVFRILIVLRSDAIHTIVCNIIRGILLYNNYDIHKIIMTLLKTPDVHPDDVSRADVIDAHVGRRLRLRRNLLGLSQEKLAESIGLTFQQVQKYERGVNRVSASKLFYISQALHVPVSFFFEDMSADYPTSQEDHDVSLHDASTTTYQDDPMQREETLQLVRAYYRLGDKDVRHKMLQFLEALGTGNQHLRKNLDDDLAKNDKRP
jgi:transcriptional regulator with XRE-family HTH domain